MESLVLAPLLQVVFEKLASLILGELQISKDFMKDIKKLHDRLPMVQAVIEDAEEQQHRDPKVKIWLERLKDVAYDADDLLDVLRTRIFRSQLKRKVWVLTPKTFINSLKISNALKDILQRFDEIAKERNDYQLRDDLFHMQHDIVDRRETGPYVNESEVYGREKDLETIVKMLLSVSSNSSRSEVVSIVGMGGIGKTTLAQLAYNDQRVTRHFDLRMWISVNNTHNFSVRKIIHNILDYTRVKCESLHLGVLQSRLHKSLRGKRYLLVLDDIWNKNLHEWENLELPLRGGADGSKIILTTRNQVVADIIGTSTNLSYSLEALNDDDCWTLFKKQAFAEGKEVAYPNLVPIGKQIVKKCRGVPLAAKILGTLMRFKREENQWLYVQECELSNLHNESIFSILILSYNHLPPHLKRCFAYCAVFPKNYEIKKEKLIQQWIAEDLIQSPVDEISSNKMEDIGNEYFRDLMSVSFFQGIRKSDDGEMTDFKMHDLIHDLARYVARNEILILKHDRPTASWGTHAQTRHVSVEGNLGKLLPDGDFCEAKRIRTLNFLSAGDNSLKALCNLIPRLRHLRVLNLSGCNIKRLQKSIGDLILLRYLDLSSTPIQKLPETVCGLCNLQTVDLKNCKDLMELPCGMSKLVNLRHMNIKSCLRLQHMPANIGKLRNLQTLPMFIVGRTFEESLFQLVPLELRGDLKITHLENVGRVPDNCLEFKQLQSLHLWWHDNEGSLSRKRVEGSFTCNTENVLNSLRPNHNLKRFYLKGYFGVVFPRWMNHIMLPNLTNLVLIHCRRCQNFPTLGQLPSLTALTIQGMHSVKAVGIEFYGSEPIRRPFPSLKELTLDDFPELETWQKRDFIEAAFPSLEKLTIIKCPRLTTLPWFPSLLQLELQVCNATILCSTIELNSLTTLVVEKFPELEHLPEELLKDKSSLTSLAVSSCHKLSSLPANLQGLASLKSLSVHDCKALETLPCGLGSLIFLENLEITDCPNITSLPEESTEGLRSLRTFSISKCSRLTCLPSNLQNLSALRNLYILNCPELVSLPRGLQHITTLQSLVIRGCPKLTELPDWIGCLVSLRSFTLSDCQNIKSLPENLQHLSALQHLSVKDCPDLARRCQEGGEDWHKICHIPHIHA